LIRSSLLYLALVCGLPSTVARADACYETSVVSPSPFLGINDEIVKLADGSVWEVKYEYAYLYAYFPRVTICPGRGKLIVERTTLNVQQLSQSRSTEQGGQQASSGSSRWTVFEETNIQGLVSGVVQRGSIFKTVSGNIYEVTGATAQAVAVAQPSVMVLRNGNVFKLNIRGFTDALICRKLN
jgi:hypothetical protein